jgi:hypothetical protein
MILSVKRNFSLHSIAQLIFVMEKSDVFFEVRTEFLNILLFIWDEALKI